MVPYRQLAYKAHPSLVVEYLLRIRSLEPYLDSQLVRLPHFVQVYEPLVDFVWAGEHVLHMAHIFSSPVAQVFVVASFFKIGRLPDDQLRHFVDVETLAAWQKSEDRRHGHSLSMDKLSEIKLLLQWWLRLDEELLVLGTIAEQHYPVVKLLDWLHQFEVLGHLSHELTLAFNILWPVLTAEWFSPLVDSCR